MAEAMPMGPAEIADYLGVSRQRAYVLINRKDFPDPWAELSMGKVWRSTEVEAYAAARQVKRQSAG